MIDLHAHVLPGLDDGPVDLEQALALLRAAARDGTRVIAATPHLRGDHPAVRAEALANAHAELITRLDDHLGVRVVIGAEVDLGWATDATDEQLHLASYRQRGSDLLVETPYGQLPASFEQMLFRLELRGYRLLLAHPERSPDFQRQPERLLALVERGVLLQLTASSLLRGRRSASGRLARQLVTRGYAHVLASDAHAHHGSRAPALAAGVAAARKLAPERADWMAGSAPAAVLAGKPLPPLPAPRGARRLLRRS
jgi:protein-tyrosine phosphatase